MKTLLIGGAIAALAMATTVSAAQPAPPPPPGVAPGTPPISAVPPVPPTMRREMRVQFNANHDMTRAEVPEHVVKMFAKLDTNRDGFITRQEIDAMRARMESAMGKMGDRQERIGEIGRRLTDRGMRMRDRAAMFDRLDTNHDGNVSRQEFMAGKPEVRQERVMIMRGPGGAPGAMSSMEGHPGMSTGMGMEMHMRHMGAMRGMGMAGLAGHMFEMADANHDGRVSLAEAQAAALAHFDKADLNHDGRITPEEHGRMRQMMRIERRG